MARKNDHLFTVRMPVDLHRRLVERAEQEERTVSALLRLLARRHVDASLAGKARNGGE